jgi:WD40 repeat protein
MVRYLRTYVFWMLVGSILLVAPNLGAEAQEAKVRIDFHGDALPAHAVARLGTLSFRHAGLTSMVFSPDGWTLYSTGSDKTVRSFDVPTGRAMHAFAYPESYAALTADGKHVVLWTPDGEIRVCDPATGKEVGRFNGHPLPERGWKPVMLLPSAKTVVTARQPPGLQGTGDGRLYFFDLASGKETMQVGEPAQAGSDSLYLRSGGAVSPDGTILATATVSRPTIVLWNTSTGKKLRQFNMPVGSVSELAFSPDGKTLASMDLSRPDIFLWNVASGLEYARLQGAPVIDWLSFSRQGNLLATQSADGTIWVWDLSKQKVQYKIAGKPLQVTAPLGQPAHRKPAFSPDGKSLAVPYGNTIVLWDMTTGTPAAAKAGGHRYSILDVLISPDANKVITRDRETTRIWDSASGKESHTIVEPTFHMALSKNGKYLGTLGDRKVETFLMGPLKIWKLSDGSLVRNIELTWRQYNKNAGGGGFAGPYTLVGVRWHDKLTVAEVAADKNLDALTGGFERSDEFPAPDDLLPDGKTQVVQQGKNLSFRDAIIGKEKLLVKGITKPWLVFPDGKTLAAVLEDGKTIALWDLAKGKQVALLAGHRDKVTCLVVNATGQRLVSGSADCTALVWDVPK